MNRQEALQIIKKHLPEKRYIHTIGVTDTAITLAKQYGADEKKAEIAGIFHDYAKYRPKQEMIDIINEEDLPKDLLMYSSELWHAPVGAILVKKEIGITDEDILRAIRSHTTGRARMTTLEKVIMLADYIEPNRSFPGVDDVRELAKLELNKALIVSIQNTIQFLLNKNELIYPKTIETYNDLQRNLNQEVN
ncbi:bis(5'-nucleosyl)-tetraphosphatase (symmetrical) YqeK [Pueribacillus sp. YX66]|uniref:bis(5'-nucleosyl)-tetraphosphatase (symmetrical) YqeK n=1 Tax=Pueribacillus sp. YX66 TaxID=3229242 RepID=UPI00358D6DF6